MTIKEQFQKLLDNWMILLLVILVFVLPNFMGTFSNMVSQRSYSADYAGSYEMSKISTPSPYYDNRNFAPDETDRKIMKTVSLATEVKRGTFKQEESNLKSILKSSDSFLLNENVNKYGEEKTAYYVGSYTIKVEAKKYDSVVSQLKLIGNVQSFREESRDITGQYTNAQIELTSEKARLDRYNQMLKEATLVADKITLNDRIFDQERTIKYMEDAINNMDKTVEYSTLYFTMNEKRSDYANIVFVKFSQLVSSMVSSFNAMMTMVFVLFPWAIVALIVRLFWVIYSRKKK